MTTCEGCHGSGGNWDCNGENENDESCECEGCTGCEACPECNGCGRSDCDCHGRCHAEIGCCNDDDGVDE